MVDAGDHRLLIVGEREYATHYSERVIRMLVARKGVHRAPLYFPFKETRGRHFLGPLFRYLRQRGRGDLRVLEAGCSFGHITEFLAEQPEVQTLHTFDTDPLFVEITRTKVAELGLTAVRDVACLTQEEACRLPYPDGGFDLVLVIGVVEHLPARFRRAQVDEYYRALAPAGHIAILDTPNRLFPLETHTVGLPLVQWMPSRLAYGYARALRPRRFARMSYDDFVGDGSAWRNASLRECLPSTGWRGLDDVTEVAGYGWRFFRDTARSRTRQALLPFFAAACEGLRVSGLPPSLALPYFNLLLRKRDPRHRAVANARI